MSASSKPTETRHEFKPYPQYTDHGIDWLGPVPSHWTVTKTKYAARLYSGHTPSRQHPEYWENCTIPWFGLADVWQIRDGQAEYVTETAEKISELGMANSAARLLPAGTVILSRTASVGFSAILGVDMATTQDFVNWVCGPKIRPEYLLWVFRSMQPEFRRLTMGSTHQTIYMPAVGAFSTPLPPLPEQDSIVAFVRERTSRIDKLIAKRERFIQLRQERSSAFITRAVTGELLRGMPMKDSGLEWLNQIPKQWEVARLRRLLRRIEQGWSPVADERQAAPDQWAVIKLSAVDRGNFVGEEHKALPPDLPPNEHLEIRDGDFLLTRANTPESVGDVCVVRAPRPRLMLCDLVYRLTLDEEQIDPNYLAFWLLSGAGRHQIEADARGASRSMVKISQSLIRGWTVLLPPLNEQRELVKLIEEETTQTETIVDKVAEAIQRLRELRTALVTAAVTGKMDVRERA